jgi:ABC-type branched-subunit amino acid transport system permease subunit
MVVVFGGVGNLWGTLVGALSLGIVNKFLEPYAGAVLGKIFVLVSSSCSSRSGRAACSRSRAGRWKHDRAALPALVRAAPRSSSPAARAVCSRCVPLLNLLLPPGSPLHVPTYIVASLLGKYLCYALLALSLDLVWGYCGILSLGHGAFFALGGYAMGMYLMRQIGRAASTAIRSCRTSWCS